MSRNPGTIFFAQISKISYYTHIFDVIYNLDEIVRNEFYFCGFYWCVNTGKSLTNWIKPEDGFIQPKEGFIQFVSDSSAFTHQ